MSRLLATSGTLQHVRVVVFRALLANLCPLETSAKGFSSLVIVLFLLSMLVDAGTALNNTHSIFGNLEDVGVRGASHWCFGQVLRSATKTNMTTKRTPFDKRDHTYTTNSIIC